MQAIVTAAAPSSQLAAPAAGADANADPALAGLFGHLVAAAEKSGTASDQAKPDPAPGSDAMAQILAGALMGVQPQPQAPLAAPISAAGDPTQGNDGAALLLAAAASDSGSTAAPTAPTLAGPDAAEPASPNVPPPPTPVPPSQLSAPPLPTSPLPAPARTDPSPPHAAARDPGAASLQIASGALEETRSPAKPITPDQPKAAAVLAARTDGPAKTDAPPTKADAAPAPPTATPPPPITSASAPAAAPSPTAPAAPEPRRADVAPVPAPFRDRPVRATATSETPRPTAVTSAAPPTAAPAQPDAAAVKLTALEPSHVIRADQAPAVAEPANTPAPLPPLPTAAAVATNEPAASSDARPTPVTQSAAPAPAIPTAPVATPAPPPASTPPPVVATVGQDLTAPAAVAAQTATATGGKAAALIASVAPKPVHAAASAEAAPVAQSQTRVEAAPAAAATAVAPAPVRDSTPGDSHGRNEQDGTYAADQDAPKTAPASGSPASFMAVAAGPASQAASAGLSQTVARLSNDIVKKIQAKASHFDLALEPEGLGRVDVRVRIAADGALSASMNFDNAHAAEAMKSRSGELRTALEQAGFNLAGSGLSFTAGGSGRQSSGGDGSNPTPQKGSVRSIEAIDAPTSPPSARASAGGLDIRI